MGGEVRVRTPVECYDLDLSLSQKMKERLRERKEGKLGICTESSFHTTLKGPHGSKSADHDVLVSTSTYLPQVPCSSSLHLIWLISGGSSLSLKSVVTGNITLLQQPPDKP